ncbi:hypothetical protein SDC9_112205 [bioreactor metagenome]|uniref:Uncharacterized protein n=1 Tax=bioreactor metagenome TaxID=1076179 RepID=A0A645BIL8_9ZZZZ
MALRDAHVKKTPGIPLGKRLQTGARLHGGGNGADGVVFRCQSGQRLPKHRGEGRLRRLHRLAGLGMKRGNAVKSIWVLLCGCITFSLYRSYMEQNRAIKLPRVAQQTGQVLHVVAVNRAQIGKAHILEHAAGQNGILKGLFQAVGNPVNVAPQGKHAHGLAVALLDAQILRLEPLMGQVLGDTPHVFGDGHAVVVEDDNHRLAALSGVGQPFVGQAAREGAVTNEGNHAILLVPKGSGPGHAQRHRDGIGGMPGDKGVVKAFTGLGITRHAAEGTQRFHHRVPSCEHLVAVALMPHVENKPVSAGVKHPVQGNGKLHRAQVGGQMAPAGGNHLHQPLPKLVTKLRNSLVGEGF